ncbi:MAG: FG-GAP repeat protein [Ignavibacteria bacterium]|nr:FG-GAP repeat protein [Ignavibacteria bacterium]
MKKIKYTLLMTFLLAAVLYPALEVNANWMKKESRSSREGYQTVESSGSEKKDSLPDGITQDWLNSLEDENGNRIFNETNAGTSREIPEDPEGDAIQRKIFNGLGANNYFGYSVSSAGDVNGDGFDDIIVGAYGNNSYTGRAYLYFGGLIMNTVADVIMTGAATDNFFGYSVSSAGDVNGDGYDDIIVSEYGYNVYTGRAYIYFGGQNMNSNADVIFTGEGVNNYFGGSVSSVGDVNGDGYSDVIVGSIPTGRVYIYFGGASMNNTADVIITGEASNNYFGRSVSSAGDVNGDGYSDVIIGAYGYSSSTGKTYIYFGGTSMDTTADLTMTGETTASQFGITVSSAGDVNSDGYSDVIIGANGYSSSTGRAYIYFGGASMNNTADVTMTGESTGNAFGGSVTSAGDVNGDGYSDVIIGANGYSSFTGRAYSFVGGRSMNNTANVTITGESIGNAFGVSVSSAGDVNGDGYYDVIIGSYGYSLNSGRVYLYDYFMKKEIIQDLKITGETTYNFLGYSVSSAGDVNGDGYSDVIVGADGYDTSTGRAYIYFGGVSMNNTADVTITGNTTGENLGFSVSSAGDVNGDGYSDVIVGSYSYSTTGRAYIYFGGVSMDSTADVVMNGEGGQFGISVSSAGDVNGDGYSDVIVGANQYSSNTGRSYIFLGGESMDNIADLRMTGNTTGEYFGYSVSSVGDVNGDGYYDVIIGAYGYTSYTGRAYIFLGAASMDSVSDVIMTGETTSNYFGLSVSSAGDVNGDGYSDVIVGEHQNSSGTGKAYIYFGGASMNNTADVTMAGETSSNYFGLSVSSAGDVNGDGYSDVIVGAWGYSSNTGRSYIYFGGLSMNSTADVTMTGEITDNYFGKSVSSAGDVNGDGYSDLITGAYVYSSYTGSSYIYLGSAISAKPILNFIKDVTNDQGGYVNIKWARSSFDVFGNDQITGYSVYRSYPPSGGNFSWEEVASVYAAHHSFYTVTSPTPYDSGSNSSGNFFFKIRAKTSNINSYWESAILYGRSIDNIAPLMVSPFTAAASGPGVLLNWKRSTAPDLLNYVLFRNVNPTIDPYTETPWTTATDSTLLDTAPLSGLYYYFIVAQDIHGNYSPVAVAESPNITVNLTMFIEGFYNAGSNTQVSDTITAYLRNSTSPYSIADQTSEVVLSDGTAQLKFGNALSGNYYLAITHRNSIETWSALPISVSSGSPAAFDLSSSLSQAYGSNQILVDASPVRFAIYSGDVNQDGTIDLADGSMIDNDAFNFVSGYVPADVNGDGIVDVADAVFADNNGFNFISKITP